MKEKSEFEKRTAEKQVSLLTEALTSAVDAKGHWLNASGKLYPKLYPKGFSVSPFNALVLALDSDAKGCKSNLFTQFSEAKARGESVREHEKGVTTLAQRRPNVWPSASTMTHSLFTVALFAEMVLKLKVSTA